MMGMRIAYMIVVLLFFVAATVRLKLKESVKNPEKISLKETLRSYPKAIKEGLNVWKVVPRSTLFLFFSDVILRSSLALTQTLFLVYAFYVLHIGGTPHPELYAAEADPALQLARVNWGYIMTTLFVFMIILSFPVGRLIDKAGRKIPLLVANLLVIPAVLLFVFGNYLTIFIAMPLIGFSILLAFSTIQTIFADLVPQTLRGKVTGSTNFFSYIFMAVSAGVGGLLYDAVSPMLPFILMAVLAIPSTMLVLFFVHEPKPEDRQV
jgi:MFS family permease